MSYVQFSMFYTMRQYKKISDIACGEGHRVRPSLLWKVDMLH